MPIYLSRLLLDPRSRDVRRDLADCHALHRRIMTGFPTVGGEARAALGVLFRPEAPPLAPRPTLLVQSSVEPTWAMLPAGYLAPAGDGRDNPGCKRVDERYATIAAGDELAFRLRANPTRRLPARSASPNRLAGKRVALLKEEEQLAWLERKAAASGFALEAVRAEANDLRRAEPGPARGAVGVAAVRAMPGGEQIGRRPRTAAHAGERLTFGEVLFEGRLRVVDPERFRQALATGIGSGKAYGFGLVSIAPVAAMTRSGDRPG